MDYIISDKQLMSEWDWTANEAEGIDPNQLSCGSKQKAHWVCENGHRWIIDIAHRTIGNTHCPYCTNRKVLPGYNDLPSRRPDLMDEWDYSTNKIDPTTLLYQSSKSVNWVCAKRHKWTVPVYRRTVNGTNCPYCSNKKVMQGYNDLESQHPELMLEWDYNSNTISPSAVVSGSKKIANWICPRGHKYTKVIYNRVNGEECPICNKGRGTSFPEQCFFYYIRQIFPDAINRCTNLFSQKMELDIYIPSIKTGIEYDGVFWHGEQALAREEKKYRICKENGVRLFRIKEGAFTGFHNNADRIWYIPKQCKNEELTAYIIDFLKKLTFFSDNIPSVDVQHDRAKILEYKTLKYEESLTAKYPQIAKEWHPTKNGNLIPDVFAPGSSEIVWWLCQQCGHEWQTSIVNRTVGHNCDICATKQRKVTKKETIIRKRGSISKELCLLDWDYEVNEHGPEYYTNGSGEIVGWKCHVCGYKWKTAICDRTRDRKNGCPLCSGKTIVAGVNDIATKRPDLVEEWDYKNNTHIDITTVGVGSHLYASWICKKCGCVWEAQIYNRTNGKGCPCCNNRVVVIGINDLSTTEPEIAMEWHPTLNGNLSPKEVTRGQSLKIWWQCKQCGNVWQDTINHRCCSNRGCSVCKKRNRKR